MSFNKPLHLAGSIIRTLLGLTFIFSGFVKAVDPLGTVYKIEDYLIAFGGLFNSLVPLAGVAAAALILFEFVLGVCLLCNVWTKITSWLSLAMMAVMTPLTLYLALTNPVSDCGCFGDAIVLSNWATFWKNVVLLALVIALLFFKKYLPATFQKWMNWVVFGSAILIAGGIMLHAYLHIPVIDFRPYKVGVNIPEKMTLPEGAKEDVYETTFIYERDGVQQEFTLENYPKDDSTWVFVDQKSVLVQKGDEAPIHDFVIMNEDYEELTYDILEAEEEVVLAIMYKLEKANKKQAARLNDLCHQAQDAGKLFYVLTGSGEETIENWKNEMQSEYEICTCDPVTLKTIVRANPGIVVLQQGTIIDKYNLRNR